MARKNKNDAIVFDEKIVEKTMEDVMHDSMIPYSEYVILERALPRAEDGLKPVQRRILYTMNELGITNDKPHRKCARIVGDCLGKYHPHGDTSVYDALARMAQDFVMREMLVDGHGNFGSIDGDSPAAMRYTEARMTPAAQELLRDIDKDTVDFHLNFDDSLQEPDVLPARFPNLLVNGASGIAVGLATNIPTHNLGECIDGAIALMEHPDMTPEEMEKYIPAPDFPTGGIVLRDEELRSALATGRGKIRVRAKVHIEDAPNGKKLIVITEIPYQVNKAAMLEKILRLSEEKKTLFSGISDIRDESDRTGMRAVIELRKDANVERVLNAMYRYSDLQTTFGVNMVAIAGGKPVQMGVLGLLNCFIKHQKNVVTRRTRYELRQAEARAHILQGLIIAVDNLDEVIRIIRGSKNPREARTALMAAFSLTEVQAQAILDMRLQRLTNLEVLSLRKEYEELLKTIKKLKAILASEQKLIEVIRGELAEIRQKYADPRRTVIMDEFSEYEEDEEEIPAQEATVVLTYDGFLKRLAKNQVPESPEPLYRWVTTATNRKLLFVTDLGNCFQIGVSQIPECRLRDRGMPVGGILSGFETAEKVLYMGELPSPKDEFLVVTQLGSAKRIAGEELLVRTRSFKYLKLREKDAAAAFLHTECVNEVILITAGGCAIDIRIEEIPVQGRIAGGVRAMTLSPNDRVIEAFPKIPASTVLIATDRGYMKRCLIGMFEKQARGGNGSVVFPLQKNGANGQALVAAFPVTGNIQITACLRSGTKQQIETDQVRVEKRTDKGQMYVLTVMDDVVTEIRR